MALFWFTVSYLRESAFICGLFFARLRFHSGRFFAFFALFRLRQTFGATGLAAIPSQLLAISYPRSAA